ncbi:uncharacterized protein LOC101860604 [Aplysia californica]|uniref:Uncharacterized protein LOC101860604 n=1 Tax=Aplysia californica TaxID=6500 RepID=A0ABM0K521_APLCA|nr:uncharacterized protein LOC101860604 [Aplysia californica]
MRPRTAHPLRGPASTLSDVIKYGFFHQVRLLVSSGVDLESRDALRRTPIILCALMEPEAWGASLAMTLIEHGARLAQRDRFGRNALHYACIYERGRLVNILLKATDFDLNQSDKMGNTALHYAAMSGNATITQALASACRKYKLSMHKTNLQGRTALEEAYFCGHGACAHAVEQVLLEKRPGSAIKDVRFADDVTVSPRYLAPPSNHVTGRSPSLRPMSAAFLTRRDSASSFTSVDDRKSSIRSRSNLSLPVYGYYRKTQSPLYALGYKNDKEVIPCVAENDFRNKPSYVFKMVHLPYDPEDWDPVSSMDSSNRTSTAWPESCSVSHTQHSVTPNDWRAELKLLFKVYENQCSASWRASRKWEPAPPVEHDPSCPGPEAGTEEKGRRGRRGSVVSRTSAKDATAPADLRRRMSTTRLKRQPSASGHSGKLDSGLDTSSESINSLASAKRRGLDSSDTGSGGRFDKCASLPSPPSTSPTNRETTLPYRKTSGPKIDVPSDDAIQLPPVHNALRPVSPRAGSSSGSRQQSVTTGPTSGRSSAIRAPDPGADDTRMGSRSLGQNVDPVGCVGAIPKVKEILAPNMTSLGGENVEVDTTKLWVQHPYEDDEEDEDGEDNNM